MLAIVNTSYCLKVFTTQVYIASLTELNPYSAYIVSEFNLKIPIISNNELQYYTHFTMHAIAVHSFCGSVKTQ